MRYVEGEPPPVRALGDLREAVGYGRAEGDYPAAFGAYGAMVAAYDRADRLVGWCAAVDDGVRHAFLVDVIVDPTVQRRGIGREIVRRVVEAERRRGIRIVHADFAADRTPFYEACGFRVCAAGVLEG